MGAPGAASKLIMGLGWRLLQVLGRIPHRQPSSGRAVLGGGCRGLPVCPLSLTCSVSQSHIPNPHPLWFFHPAAPLSAGQRGPLVSDASPWQALQGYAQPSDSQNKEVPIWR